MTTRDEVVKQFETLAQGLGKLRDLVFASDLLEHAGDTVNPPAQTLYGQRDPQWATLRLGTSASTIGGYGCLITSVASCLTDAGRKMTPAELNEWLTLNGGYTGGNLLVFAAVDRLSVFKFYGLIECAHIPAPVDQFDALVANRDFIVVKVDFDPRTMAVEEHWVRYLGQGQMMDPWQGDVAPIVPRYRGRDAAQAILRAAIYKRVSA